MIPLLSIMNIGGSLYIREIDGTRAARGNRRELIKEREIIKNDNRPFGALYGSLIKK